MPPEDLPVRISRARKARGLSMRELARLSGVSVATIHNLEAGKSRPYGRTLRKILKALEKVSKLPRID